MRHTGVSLRQIKRYLKEERLEIVGDNKGFIRCDYAETLNSGRFCDLCYRKGYQGAKEVKATSYTRLNEDKHKYTTEVRIMGRNKAVEIMYMS